MTAASSLSVDMDGLSAELHTLARFTEQNPSPAEGTAVTRVVFTQPDLQARAYVDSLACNAGLSVRKDAVGNTFFRWQGTQPELAAVATGSHIDAIPNAGMYDGTVGVLGGLEAIRTLQSSGFTPKRSIDLILFTSEEPTRFGIGCLGSRMLSGQLSAEAVAQLCDKDGLSLDSARGNSFPGTLNDVKLPPGAYSAFVELHIEQGPLLERAGIPIGIVTHIAAPASLTITLEGEGGHAGAMLMPVRKDALVAAAEIIQAVEKAALATGSIDTVATVGICDVFPGAVNSVPSRVKLALDVRDIDGQRLERVLDQIRRACEEIATRRRVLFTQQFLNHDQPVTCAPNLLEAIARACEAEVISSQRMVSRAYHDTLFMSRIAPSAMIFIPCRNGFSHRPDEYAAPEDIARGVAVLARTLADLSS